MIKVNNKKYIKRLARNTSKANKMQNIFAIIAIVLTSVLFTGLFTISVSLQRSMEESTMRQSGGSAHGTYKDLTEEQYEILSKSSKIKSISYSVFLGYAKNQELIKHPSELRYVSDVTNAKERFAYPTTGSLPEADNEIAMDTIVLDFLGIPAKLGEQVTIEYQLQEKNYSDTFTLVGFWDGDIIAPASQILLSRNYITKQLANYISVDENDLVGQLDADVLFYNTVNIEKKMQEVILECGFGENEIQYGINWAYSGNNGNVGLETIVGIILALSMIILCGYLMISNVFYISIVRDTRYYGLLKSIGTTGKQIRFIIRRQALILCLFGIPIGLGCGYAIGCFLAPVILNIIETDSIYIVTDPFIFALSAIFSMITVFISIFRPAHIASKISPMEALRSNDNKGVYKKKRKSGKTNLLSMAYYNVFRNPQKAVLVIASLSLSLVLLNATYSAANSFNMDKFLNRMISSDFAVANNSYFSDAYSGDGINQELLNELSDLKGVQAVNKIYAYEVPQTFQEQSGNNQMDTIVYGVDDNIFQCLDVRSGKIDLDKLKDGKYAVVNVSTYEESVDSNDLEFYRVGDTIEVSGKNGNMKAYEIIAVAEMPYNISVRYAFSTMTEVILPSSVYQEDIANSEPMLATLEVEKQQETEVEKFLADYCSSVDPYMQYQSKAQLVAEFEKTQNTFICVGSALSFLVGFLGLANFINTLITSVMSRRREFAMLQSIGMTRKQTTIMLISEGLIYTIATTFLALTIGSATGYFGITALLNGSNYLDLKYRIFPSLICVPVLIIIAALIPNVTQRVVSRESVIERLRMTE